MLLIRRLTCCRSLSHDRRISSALLLWMLAMLICLSVLPSRLQAQPAQGPLFTIEPGQPGEVPDDVVLVPAQGLSHLVVSRPAGKLIRGHDDQSPQITLVPLDDQGVPVADAPAGKITFPSNGLNAAQKDHVLSITVHPTLPVAYVWRDLASRPNQVTAVNDDYRAYEHLLIYDIAGSEPKLLFSGCKGDDFQIRRARGIVSISDDGRTLFMPNLTYKTRRSRGVALGMYHLDAKGLPILQGAEPEPDVQLAPPSEAEAEAEADEAVPSHRGGGLTMITLNEIGSRYPGQQAFLIDKDHALVLSSNYLLGYNFASRAARMAAAFIPDSHPAHMRLAIHPTLPIAYLASGHNSRMTAWAHFNGYPSLQPQQAYLPHQPIYSFPVVMAKQKRLAFGSKGRVVMIHLDDQGWMTDATDQFPVKNNQVDLLAYQPDYDRLYVGTNQPWEQP